MSIDRGTDKEDVVHIYNGILLGHLKGKDCVICRDVHGPIDCHTEWSKSERKTTLTCMCGILFAKQKQRHRCIKQINGYQGEVGECDALGNWDWYVHTTMYKMYYNENLLYSTRNSTWCSVIT